MRPPTYGEIRIAFPDMPIDQLLAAASFSEELPLPLNDERQLTWSMSQAVVMWHALQSAFGGHVEATGVIAMFGRCSKLLGSSSDGKLIHKDGNELVLWRLLLADGIYEVIDGRDEILDIRNYSIVSELAPPVVTTSVDLATAWRRARQRFERIQDAGCNRFDSIEVGEDVRKEGCVRYDAIDSSG